MESKYESPFDRMKREKKEQKEIQKEDQIEMVKEKIKIKKPYMNDEENQKDENEMIKAAAIAYAKRKVFTEVYTELYREQMLNGGFGELIPENDLNRYKEILEEKQNKKENSKRKGKGLMVTINPPDDLDFEEFKKLVEDCTKWKWIEKYIYTFETRGYDDDEVKGVHCHIFLDRGGYTPGHVERDFKKKFKNYMEVDNPHILNIKYFKDEDLSNGFNYVKGIKRGNKKSNYESDKRFRKEKSLGDFYTSHSKLETGKEEIES